MKVQVHRGKFIESVHQVSWVAMNFDGTIVGSDGDPSQMVFPRSAIKMLQVLPFLRLKKELNQNISDQEVACSCASHAGEPQHIEVVSKWLQRLNLNEKNLCCGPQAPYDEKSNHRLIREGAQPTRLHNNCSGKHASQLEYAQLLKAPIENYFSADHPVQKNIQSVLSEISGESVTQWGVDGCGIPAWRISLKGFAKAMAEFGKKSLIANSAEAQALKAFMAFPQLTSGKEEFCAQAMEKFPGDLLLKVGAEGVMTAVVPSAKLAIVLKVEDGSERATSVAISSLLSRFIPKMKEGLAQWAHPEIRNWAGTHCGLIDVDSAL